MTGKVTRRAFGVGALATLCSGSIAIGLLTDNATATANIESGGFSIPSTSKTVVDGTVQDVVVDASLNYEWESNVDVTRYEITLAAGFSADTAEIIARVDNPDIAKQSLSGTESLTASLLSAADFDTDLFAPEGGEKEVKATIVCELLVYRDGEILATDTIQDDLTITVTEESVSLSGQFDGSGNVTVQTG